MNQKKKIQMPTRKLKRKNTPPPSPTLSWTLPKGFKQHRQSIMRGHLWRENQDPLATVDDRTGETHRRPPSAGHRQIGRRQISFLLKKRGRDMKNWSRCSQHEE